MITTKIYLDRRAVKGNGPAPLKIAITKKGSTSYIPLGISLLPEQWNPTKQCVVSHPKRQFFNTYINKRKLEVDEIILTLTAAKETAGSVTDIKNIVVSRLNPEADSDESITFYNWFVKFSSTKMIRTKGIYDTTLNHIKRFRPKTYRQLKFEDITVEWLSEFDAFLAKTSPARNARNINLRNIRAVFNYAIDNDVTSAYPFRKFKLRYEETRKRSMPVEALRKLKDLKVEPYLEKYRDFFMLSFYLIGANVVDICQAVELVDGRFEYRRSKTHKLYSIKVEPEAMALIEKYKGEKYLLNYLDTHKSYRTFYNCLQKGLVKIKDAFNAVDDGIVLQELTSYWARHTWATIASDLEIPDATIAKSLGHSHGNATSAIYIDYNMRKVDVANRRVIDRVIKGESEVMEQKEP